MSASPNYPRKQASLIREIIDPPLTKAKDNHDGHKHIINTALWHGIVVWWIVAP